jgi:hypothetical protein
MTNSLFRISVVLGLVGVGLGIFMGIRQDFSLMPAHAHLNLVGFVALFLTALYYRAVPQAAVTRLAKIQALLAIAGAILFPIGIACVTLGDHQRYLPVIMAGALAVFTGMALFTLVVFRASAVTRHARAQPLQVSSINA